MKRLILILFFFTAYLSSSFAGVFSLAFVPALDDSVLLEARVYFMTGPDECSPVRAFTTNINLDTLKVSAFYKENGISQQGCGTTDTFYLGKWSQFSGINVITVLAYNIDTFPDPEDTTLEGDKSIDRSLGINSLVKSDAIQLFPNPVKDLLNIAGVPDYQEIILTDITGRILNYFKNTRQIDMSEQPDGLYLLRIKTKDGIVTKRIQKE